MSEYVMHMQLEKSADFSICGKNSYTAHIRTTKDATKVSCSRCLKRMYKYKPNEILNTAKTGEF